MTFESSMDTVCAARQLLVAFDPSFWNTEVRAPIPRNCKRCSSTESCKLVST
ncbi:hypothetical protein BDP81DRAFT_442416 [Colletotrichum phormii]|uniref:Uncharacterized protein n=1 Tax=Colletotrichum phormii TaxID=359342 RepID=A0AAI9ZCJ7_9PEZI|nr:uncharacterized protein BDP81DRAFT_442416 [Colletotrichum phormii]KAK1622024.1 hypothetical protein BDP81DRAFT_442416 [Colletotrichum phormii]